MHTQLFLVTQKVNDLVIIQKIAILDFADFEDISVSQTVQISKE